MTCATGDRQMKSGTVDVSAPLAVMEDGMAHKSSVHSTFCAFRIMAENNAIDSIRYFMVLSPFVIAQFQVLCYINAEARLKLFSALLPVLDSSSW